MDEVSVNGRGERDDYLDQLSRVLPLRRSFTSHERILIVLIVSIFVSIVGCLLLCLFCSQCPLRRRYSGKKKRDIERRFLVASAPSNGTLVYSPPPRYESIVKADDITAFNNLCKSRYLDLARKSSHGTASDSDGVQSNNSGDYPPSLNGKILRSQSARSSFSNGGSLSTTINTYPLPPFAQINVEFNIDTTKNIFTVHLTNGEHISIHPAFDEQADFFIHLQLLNNKILKKFHDGWKKRRTSLQLSTWKKLQEKTTKKLSRLSNDTLTCNEYLRFELNRDDITSTSLRFLLFCIDRSGAQDLMSEAILRLNLPMIPNYQQIIEFKDFPQITFGELFLGISYLPTAERFTIRINKLRYFCKIEKDEKLDARLIATFFHHGRRFFQKKLPSIIFDQSITRNNNVYEIKDAIMQNIPQNDIQSIYVHFELILHILHSKTESIISCGSILLGEQTRYQTDWQKMLEQPRQIHLGWYQFFG